MDPTASDSGIPVTDLQSFLRDPIGRTCTSANAFVWRPLAELQVLVLWGTPEAADIELLIRAQAAGPNIRRAGIFDVRGLDTFGNALLAEAPRVLRTMRDHDQATLVHSAIVHGNAKSHALLLGYKAMTVGSDRMSAHETLEAALARVHGAIAPEALAHAIAARRTLASEGASLATTCRAWIEANLAEAALPIFAQSLGTSPRTLQRRLRVAGICFRTEVDRLRLARARQLFEHGATKVEVVARELGYTRMQSLAALIRRETRQRPETWREAIRHKATPEV